MTVIVKGDNLYNSLGYLYNLKTMYTIQPKITNCDHHTLSTVPNRNYAPSSNKSCSPGLTNEVRKKARN